MSKQDNNMVMLTHLSGLLGILGPLIIWLMKKDEDPRVDVNGKEAINFHISYYIYMMVIGTITLSFGLWIIMPAYYIFVVIAAMKANAGEDYKYPLIFRFLK